MLNWTYQFDICAFLDNHQYQGEHHSFECLLGAGALHRLECNAGNAFERLQQMHAEHGDWLFGHLGYDLKNELFPLTSEHPDPVGFSDMFFFVPEVVILLGKDAIHIGVHGDDHAKLWEAIVNQPFAGWVGVQSPFQTWQRFSKPEYIGIIEQLKQHILRGDCYEINFCQQFYGENVKLIPLRLYEELCAASPNPFSAYYKCIDKYLLCASPERYLRKEGDRLLSQPIKGTMARHKFDASQDEQRKEQLQKSAKDRSENVMVVDLVRNDLAMVCEEGSVQVDELFGIYSFPQVHQMISTISGTLRNDLSWVDAIKATFPMGSMTGAPKRRVMELIEKYEAVKRGIFSGAVGYITPDADFDFNVVIRSILYNETTGYVSWLAGGGITFYSDPQQEYEESLLKAKAIRQVFGEAEKESFRDVEARWNKPTEGQ
ncbi:para-aminobenzoate synthetase component 1 [Pseudobacter ginsenosidimutans]|uniref:Para-aminobenzoate synthetase component 1 n=2 Tax=Pseudobacter ginsenosidimutans TaxID=661488 RepID=A0A4Q7MST7_9BACT|nr:anthranilate synthase component I family protein [Pseudobacter ginsenosidimutans]RZS70994.1 para-aminobenzoate synthetase component 1 [Pseudobacter ginsenosidimutans]